MQDTLHIAIGAQDLIIMKCYYSGSEIPTNFYDKILAMKSDTMVNKEDFNGE